MWRWVIVPLLTPQLAPDSDHSPCRWTWSKSGSSLSALHSPRHNGHLLRAGM